jgi:dUTPase
MIHVDFRGTHGEFKYHSAWSVGADVPAQPGREGDPHWNATKGVWVIRPGERIKIPSGLFVGETVRHAMPLRLKVVTGFMHMIGIELIPYLQVFPRSGKTASGIDSKTGTVDLDYCGNEIFLVLKNDTKETVDIRPGDRVAQLVGKLSWRIPGADFTDAVRTSGFGSTGG